jgi:hypothetical protein
MTGHGHGHDHGRGRPPWTAGEQPPAGGPVMLDIGGEVGALIVHLGAERIGSELHLRPAGTSEHGTHTGIWERTLGGRPAVVAVYGSVASGRYDLVDDDGHVLATAAVEGGRVAEVDLRG